MTRIQKIREDIFRLQCLDRESSIVSVDDFEWTLGQLQLAQRSVSELCDALRASHAGGSAEALDPHPHAAVLQRAEALLLGLEVRTQESSPNDSTCR